MEELTACLLAHEKSTLESQPQHPKNTAIKEKGELLETVSLRRGWNAVQAMGNLAFVSKLAVYS